MSLDRTLTMGIAALALGACSAGEDGRRSAAKISEIDWTLQESGQTWIGSAAVGYQGDHVKDVAFRENGVATGRMEFRYAGDQVQGIDVTDADGDRGSYSWNYDDGRLSSIVWSVAQVVSHEQEFEYDDDAGGRARRVTSTTTWVGSAPTSSVANYDYDDEGRLAEISSIQGSNTWSSEIRYDQDSRIERFTEYSGTDFLDADLTYADDGRLSMIEWSNSDRYELDYDDDGRIEEIMVLSPSNGITVTVAYRYTEGSVAGTTFTPYLPVAGLVDQNGMPFDQADFTALPPTLVASDVPAPEPPSTCSHDVCEIGGPLGSSCDSCAATVCSLDSYCCTTSWDGVCVDAAINQCGITC